VGCSHMGIQLSPQFSALHTLSLISCDSLPSAVHDSVNDPGKWSSGGLSYVGLIQSSRVFWLFSLIS